MAHGLPDFLRQKIRQPGGENGVKRVLGVRGAKQRNPMDTQDSVFYGPAHNRNRGDHDGPGYFPGFQNGENFSPAIFQMF